MSILPRWTANARGGVSNPPAEGAIFDRMETPTRQVRTGKLDDRDDDADYVGFTPAERMAMVWPLTVRAWTIMSAAQGNRYDAELIGGSKIVRSAVG